MMLPAKPCWSLASALVFGCAADPNADLAAPDLTAESRFVALAEAPVALPADLADIRAAGVLRVLVQRSDLEALPRPGSPSHDELTLFDDLANSLGVRARFVVAAPGQNLIEPLLSGRGDIVAAQPEAAGSPATIMRSAPVRFVDEVAVCRKGDAAQPRSLKDLARRPVFLNAGSPSLATLSEVAKSIGKPIKVTSVIEPLDAEQMLSRVGAGDFALTVAYDDEVRAYARYGEDVAVALTLRSRVPLVWTLRAGAKQLNEAVNGFLFERDLSAHRARIYGGDLEAIQARKVIRIAMLNNAASYFIYRGAQVGFQYEWAEHLARRLGVRLEVVVPDRPSELPRLVEEQRVDLVPISLTEDASVAGMELSRPFIFADWRLVQPTGEVPLATVAELHGKTIHLRASSAYYPLLSKLAEQVPDLHIVNAPEDAETEDLIDAVGKKQIPLTISNTILLDMETTFRDDVQGTLVLAEHQPLVYGMRKDAPKLLAWVNAFIAKEYHGAKYNLLYAKYFNNKKRMQEVHSQAATAAGAISPYDEMVRRYAQQFGLDWRLVVAQMYQESKFNAQAKSWVGAIGLLQIMPRTGRELGFKDVQKPDDNIHAGVKYMAQLMARLDPTIPTRQRVRFALAAYNAGMGHVSDARLLAKQRGLDGDKWFGNVEQTIALLEKPAFARRARHGYCRGSEPAQYVSNIQTKYDAYVTLVPAEGD